VPKSPNSPRIIGLSFHLSTSAEQGTFVIVVDVLAEGSYFPSAVHFFFAPMYTCTDCGKTYSSQNSLTRHAHNHRKSKQYACTVCNVVFYRRDLLSRHMGMHKRHLTESSPSVSSLSQGQSNVSRQRCHTACTRCRECKTRCNGKLPCLSCSRAGKNCEYSRNSSRISDASILRKPCSDDGGEGQSFAQPWLPETSPLVELDQSMVPPEPEDFNSPEEFHSMAGQMVDSPAVVSGATVANNLVQDQYFGDMSLWSRNTTDNIAWPWLHESLFLQDDALSFFPTDDFSIFCNGDGNGHHASGQDQTIGAYHGLPSWQQPSGSSHNLMLNHSAHVDVSIRERAPQDMSTGVGAQLRMDSSVSGKYNQTASH
jgi:hypothetical protein